MTHRTMEMPIRNYRQTPNEKRDISGTETTYTPAQVSSLFNLERNTIYSYVKTGKLKAFRIPGTNKIRFRKSYIDGIINGGTI